MPSWEAYIESPYAVYFPNAPDVKGAVELQEADPTNARFVKDEEIFLKRKTTQPQAKHRQR